jgi:hypothetical protein
MPSMRKSGWPVYAGLALILAAGLAVRLHNADHGLPFVYHPDEALHFTNRALQMLETGSLDPVYLANPSAYTYLVYGLLRVTEDPASASAYLTARYLSIALCMLAVLGVFAVGRRLWGASEGVAAAAVLSFAFLPVAYSRFALTDAGVLLPVVVAVYAAVRAGEDGRLRYFVLGGVAMGLAIGFKYTAGMVGLPLLAAAGLRVARRDRAAAAYVGGSGILAAATFALTTPHFFLDLPTALDQLSRQGSAAGEAKLGQGDVEPVSFYLGTLTWGLGWGAALAAAAGAVHELRRNPVRALLLALFPLAFFLYLCTAGRFFARWLMPVYPVLALLAGVALASAAARASRRPVVRAGVLAALLLAVLAQPILADLRTVRMLGRDDTRTLTRDHLLRTLPRKARVVVEPAVPNGFLGSELVRGFRPPRQELLEGGSAKRYVLALEPQSIDRYRRTGFCTVVTVSTIVGRAQRDGIAPALAYYERLDRESDVVFGATPFRPGAEHPPFSFDKSTHLYYDSAYERPGPEVRVHRLHRCRQGVGGPRTHAPVPARALEAQRRRLAGA